MYLCATFWSTKSCIYLLGWLARLGQDKMTWVSPRCSMTQKISSRHQYMGNFGMKRQTPKVQNGIPILMSWEFFVKEIWSFKVRFEVHQNMFRLNDLWINVSMWTIVQWVCITPPPPRPRKHFGLEGLEIKLPKWLSTILRAIWETKSSLI